VGLSHPYSEGRSSSCFFLEVSGNAMKKFLIVRIQPSRMLYQHLHREIFIIPRNNSRSRGSIPRPLLPHSINSSIGIRRSLLLTPLLWDNRNHNTSNSNPNPNPKCTTTSRNHNHNHNHINCKCKCKCKCNNKYSLITILLRLRFLNTTSNIGLRKHLLPPTPPLPLPLHQFANP